MVMSGGDVGCRREREQGGRQMSGAADIGAGRCGERQISGAADVGSGMKKGGMRRKMPMGKLGGGCFGYVLKFKEKSAMEKVAWKRWRGAAEGNR